MTETFQISSRPKPKIHRPRLGFAGVGWIGRNRLEAIQRSELATIAAVADVVSASAERVVHEMAPNASVAQSFEELLALDLDGVVIATPNALHASQTIAALRRGLAVFCQKPLTRTAAETRLVLNAAREADRLLGVDFSYRYTTGVQRIRELIRAGTLGHIYGVELVFHNAYGPDKPWFYDSRLSGGGCLLDLGIHLVDLALWCLDFPEVRKVTGRTLDCANFAGGPATGVEDYATGLLTLTNGACIQLACSWRAPAGCDARIGATFFGTAGGASFHNVNGSFYDFRAEHFLPDRSRRSLAEPPEDWGGRAAIAWVHQLRTSPHYDRAIETTVKVADVLDKIYEERT